MFGEEGYKKLEFPCYLIETYQLERYLEAKAEQGKVFADFSNFGLSGKFEDAMPKKFHYCVDVYYRPIKRKELAAAEFEEYKATCLSCGWHYVSAFENIVVFYSDEEVRPPELQTDPELKQDILTRVTLKAEQKRMIIRALSKLFVAVIFLINPLIILLQGGAGDWNRWDLVSFGMFFVWPLVIVWELLEYRRFVKKLREGQPPTDEGRPRDSWSFVIFLLAIIGLFMTIECFWFRLYKAGMRGVMMIVFLLGALLLTKQRIKQNNSEAERWKLERPTWAEIFALCCGGVLLVSVTMSLPLSDNYRFMLGDGSSNYETLDYPAAREASAYNAAVYPEDIGFGAEWDEAIYHNNPSHYAEQEQIVYVIDPDSYNAEFKGRGNTKSRLRYIGTMTSRLIDKEKIDSYLKSKKLILKDAEKLELLPGVDSYLLASGKEMVHIKENLVVVHFLNKNDERRFDLNGEEIKKAVRKKLERNFFT